MRLSSPPSRFMSRCARRVSTAPAPKNSRLLNSMWLRACNSAAVIASAAAPPRPLRLERDRQAKPDEDEADVLDRREGEHALEIDLHQRCSTPRRPRRGADDEHRYAPAPVGRADEIEDDADKAVDRDLRHHAAHQRRHMARRGGMGERQPDMQRRQARLRSGADQRQHQRQGRDRRGGGRRAWRQKA